MTPDELAALRKLADVWLHSSDTGIAIIVVDEPGAVDHRAALAGGEAGNGRSVVVILGDVAVVVEGLQKGKCGSSVRRPPSLRCAN